MTHKCPRCGGWLYLEHDKWGWTMCCILCGYEQDVLKRDKVVTSANVASKRIVLTVSWKT